MTTETTVEAPEIGTPATYSILGDAYPAVVVDRTASGRTVWLRIVSALHVDEDTVVGTGWDTTDTILDPESVEYAIARGRLEVRVTETPYGPIREEDHAMKAMYRDGRYRLVGNGSGRISIGTARSKRDPHV